MRVKELVQQAMMDQLGKGYFLGAEGPNTFDCSGLLYFALRKVGLSTFPRLAAREYYAIAKRPPVSMYKQEDDMIRLAFLKDPTGDVVHVALHIIGNHWVSALQAYTYNHVAVHTLYQADHTAGYTWEIAYMDLKDLFLRYW